MNRSGSRAGEELLRERVRGYVRYADILEEQEAAADQGDLDRVEALSQELAALEATLGEPSLTAAASPGGTEPSDDSGPPADGTDLSEPELRVVLERAAATQRRLTQKLRARRDAARAEIRQMDGRADQVRSYLRGGARERGRLNVRF